MNEDQLYDAAEREMDLYRAEITRITAARDEYRDNAVLHVRERNEARADRDDYAARLRAADQSWTKVAAERDRLRELLDEIGVMAANAPEDGDSFGLLETIAMRIAAASVPDTTPIDEWPDPSAGSRRDATDAQALHDSPGSDL